MSASLLTISMLDEEDACIHKHEMAITKTKCAKEEMQRQCEEEEAQRAAEAERLWREAEAEKAQREAEAKEAQRMVEAEEAQKRAEDEERAQEEAEKAWVEDEKKRKAVAWALRNKQLEELSQGKVTMHIAQEEDAQRALEDNGEPSHSGIAGYGKGKAPEKCISRTGSVNEWLGNCAK